MSDFISAPKYIDADELETIFQICDTARRTPDSRKNLEYTIFSFSNHIKKNPLLADSKDLASYLSFLKLQCDHKILNESSCYVLFMELRSFFDVASNLQVLSGESLFNHIQNPFHWPYGNQIESIPSLKDLDTLISLTQSNLFLYLAILLAFRMTLPISEIVELRRSDIVQNEKDGRYYLITQRYIDDMREEAYLLIPEDVIAIIEKSINTATDDANPYLIRSPRRRAVTIRSLQHTLKVVQQDTSLNITFSKLRILGIYCMIASQVPFDSLCAYTGLSPQRCQFLTCMIPDSLCLDAASYVHIRIG